MTAIRKRRHARIAIAFLLLGASAFALAQVQQVYRYVDKDGQDRKSVV